MNNIIHYMVNNIIHFTTYDITNFLTNNTIHYTMSIIYFIMYTITQCKCYILYSA